MKMPVQVAHRTTLRKGLPRAQWKQPQRGVVLVIALILLVVISVLAVTGMRNASSSESVLGNVRTTELATQAAEVALRHCESSVLKMQKNAKGDTSSPEATYPTTFSLAHILTASTPPHWQDTAGNWDVAPSSVYVIPMSFTTRREWRLPLNCANPSAWSSHCLSCYRMVLLSIRPHLSSLPAALVLKLPPPMDTRDAGSPTFQAREPTTKRRRNVFIRASSKKVFDHTDGKTET